MRFSLLLVTAGLFLIVSCGSERQQSQLSSDVGIPSNEDFAMYTVTLKSGVDEVGCLAKMKSSLPGTEFIQRFAEREFGAEMQGLQASQLAYDLQNCILKVELDETQPSDF